MTIFEQVVAEVEPYLGSRSDLFVRRLCDNHLHISHNKLSKEHLTQLSFWARISSSLIISRDQAESLEEKILALGKDA